MGGMAIVGDQPGGTAIGLLPGQTWVPGVQGPNYVPPPPMWLGAVAYGAARGIPFHKDPGPYDCAVEGSVELITGQPSQTPAEDQLVEQTYAERH